MTPFEIASENSTSFEFVMLFLKGGEDGDDSGFQFKRRSEKGLLCACQYGRLKTVQQLIDKIRVDRQCSDSDGNTCLHLATQFGHDDVVIHVCINKYINIYIAPLCTKIDGH